MDQAHIDEVAARLRAQDPERFERVAADLRELAGKSIDDLDPLEAAEAIILAADERLRG